MNLDLTECNRRVVDLLINERRRAGLRQQELAKRIKQPQSFVSRVEHGQRRISICEYFALADAIGFDGFKALRRIIADA